MALGKGRKKSYHERSLTTSKSRTGKKGRKIPRKKPVRGYSPVSRTKETTGHWTPPDKDKS